MSVTVPPWFNAVLSAVRGLCIAVGALMIGLHYDDNDAYKWVIEISGATMIVGPLIWGVWAAGVQLYRSIAVGVQAGISMTVQGKAITDDGAIIDQFNASVADATPPKAVTIETAKQIVADFGPRPSAIKNKE